MKKEFLFKTVMIALSMLIFTSITFSQANWIIKNSSNSPLANNMVNSLYQSTDGDIWVGTKNGLNVIDGDNWTEFSKSTGLPHKSVLDIDEDSEGNIWVTTLKGTTVFNGKDWSTFDKNNGLVNNKVFAVETDTKGNVWFGTKKGVSMFDGKNWTTYTKANGLLHNTVLDIMVDKDGDIWFATAKGVSVFDGQNWKSYDKGDGLARNFVWSLAEDSQGNIWFGTHTGAFNKFDGLNWELIKKGSGYYDVNMLVLGVADGIVFTLLLGAPIGAAFFVLSAALGAAPSPSHATSILVDSQGRVWLAPQPKGVFMLDGQNWMQYSQNNGLPHKRVYDMLETKDGDIWFGTLKGIGILQE